VSAECDYYFGLDYLDLLLKVGQAANYLFGAGVAIFRRATFQNIANKHIAPLEPTRLNYAVQQLACSSDEGPALQVLIAPRCLTNKDQPRRRAALAGNSVSANRAQIALTARSNFLCQLLKLCLFPGGDTAIDLLLAWRRWIPAFDTKAAAEKLVHLGVLANRLAYINISFHYAEF
jgi:hypothetical protein